ncbi:MAG: hypothetical protein SGJ21_04630 [Alphaproteobacteria bacterium]|mgnify:CR=1 FL=1|nr:hypothetical protein [Alphaproteobacteria bacterium]
MQYRTLNADNIETTIERLLARIEERFPGRGLGKLCTELLQVAREDRKRLSWQAKPNILLRLLVLVAVVGGLAAFTWLGFWMRSMSVANEAFSALQGIEAAISAIALSGAAIWFLLNLETIWRRRSVLKDLHELRSIAHVVDMHQLTKDPTTMSRAYTETPSSQPHNMTEFELIRYLDYCTEMLACTGKLAALYMQGVRDPVIIAAVMEIEDLTGNLSRKIWQKIMVLRQPGDQLAPDIPAVAPIPTLQV